MNANGPGSALNSCKSRTCRAVRGSQTNVVRVANRALVDGHIAAAFARLSRTDAAARLRAANTAFGFVNSVAEFAGHPALRRTEVATPNGPVRLAAPPVLVDGEPRPLGPVPAIGEHSTAIRAEFAA